jgi:hypothetical protein
MWLERTLCVSGIESKCVQSRAAAAHNRFVYSSARHVWPFGNTATPPNVTSLLALGVWAMAYEA